MPEQSKSRAEVLHMIAEDAERDAREFEGRPFTGRVVSEALGNIWASIHALATILEKQEEEKAVPNA